MSGNSSLNPSPAGPRGTGLRQALRRALAGLSLVAVSCLVPLVLIEAGLRVFAPQNLALNVSEWHPTYGWRNRPGARGFFQTSEFRFDIQIDSLGLRYREIPRAKPPGTYRILGLGDSFAFGHGVDADSCFLAGAERELSARAARAGGPQVELLNSGVGKWGTAQEYLYLTHEGFTFEPDLVLLAFCIDNDFENNLDSGVLRLEGDRLVQVPTPEPTVRALQRATRYVPAYNYLTMHSHLVNFVRVRASILDHRLRVARAARSAGGAHPGPARDAGRAPGLEITARILDAMVEAAGRAGVPLAVLFVPSYSECAPQGWAALRLQDPRPLRAAVTELAPRLESSGAVVVDPLPVFQQASRERLLYFPRDGHLNEAGSQLMRQVLADSLVAGGAVRF